ncbi:MAG: tRNA (adenosine(37)-N6)-threonylcarbamoyltransferase complex transferase subunit TsaD [Bdellovibrionota bacterium]
MIYTVLAIETSCDETAISIVSGKKNNNQLSEINIHAHVIESQIQIHAVFGGVVPEVAARDHLAKIYDVAKCALNSANIPLAQINAIAVTLGPGLIGALMVGVLFARGLAVSLSKPLIGVNHIDAHLSPALLVKNFSQETDLNTWKIVEYPEFPALALTVSGGHCHLSYLKNIHEKVILGKTLDDACGEAFDKVGKLLGLGYPGGPAIEIMAQKARLAGETNLYTFPHKIADTKNRYSFSYSGIKTAVMEVVRKETGHFKGKISGAQLSSELKQSIAYSFQEAALSQLLNRVQNALNDFPEIKSVLIAGGVAQNKRFREIFSSLSVPLHFAPPSLCSDNATMIALQALLAQKYDGFKDQAFARY